MLWGHNAPLCLPSLIGPPALASGVACSTSKANTVVAPAHSIGGTHFERRQVPTGTYCGGNYPEQIEYRYALVNRAEVPSGPKRSALLQTRGCPDDAAAMAREQRRSKP